MLLAYSKNYIKREFTINFIPFLIHKEETRKEIIPCGMQAAAGPEETGQPASQSPMFFIHFICGGVCLFVLFLILVIFFDQQEVSR